MSQVEIQIVPRDKNRPKRVTTAPVVPAAKPDKSKTYEVVVEPNGKTTTGKARNYLTRTIYKFYRWMTVHPEMKADVWQELELALLQHDYPEDSAEILRAQATLKSRLYFLHKAHGIQPNAQGKLEQRYRQIANSARFTGNV